MHENQNLLETMEQAIQQRMLVLEKKFQDLKKEIDKKDADYKRLERRLDLEQKKRKQAEAQLIELNKMNGWSSSTNS